MIIQYLHKNVQVKKASGETVNLKGQRCGVMVAQRVGDEILFGYSVKCNGDFQEDYSYNARVKIVNTESYKQKAANPEVELKVEPLRPLFDSKVSLDMAIERCSVNGVEYNKLPRVVKSNVKRFLGRAVCELGGNLKVTK